jgi:hypothetical protein
MTDALHLRSSCHLHVVKFVTCGYVFKSMLQNTVCCMIRIEKMRSNYELDVLGDFGPKFRVGKLKLAPLDTSTPSPRLSTTCASPYLLATRTVTFVRRHSLI